jgi:hypothetical protein
LTPEAARHLTPRVLPVVLAAGVRGFRVGRVSGGADVLRQGVRRDSLDNCVTADYSVIVMHFPRAAILLFGLVLLMAASAAAAPKPPPEFWSPARCERVLPKQHPLIRQVICVGSGGPGSCRWTSGERARLYSELTVFAWYRQANFTSLGMSGLEPGVVRSFTLATRARPGFGRIVHHYGDGYAGWPADFFMGHVRLLATHVAPARFHSTFAPVAARLRHQNEATGCNSL